MIILKTLKNFGKVPLKNKIFKILTNITDKKNEVEIDEKYFTEMGNVLSIL
jgi:hypothetical protein